MEQEPLSDFRRDVWAEVEYVLRADQIARRIRRRGLARARWIARRIRRELAA